MSKALGRQLPCYPALQGQRKDLQLGLSTSSIGKCWFQDRVLITRALPDDSQSRGSNPQAQDWPDQPSPRAGGPLEGAGVLLQAWSQAPPLPLQHCIATQTGSGRILTAETDGDTRNLSPRPALFSPLKANVLCRTAPKRCLLTSTSSTQPADISVNTTSPCVL